MPTAFEMPVTATGVSAVVLSVLLPNCPALLSPQHLAVPFARSAQVWLRPTEMATAPASPLTVTGTFELLLVPLPR